MSSQHEHAGAHRLIRRKLALPVVASSTSVRPRLDARIQSQLAQTPVVVVCAAAGSGKTIAVASALSAGTRPIAWVSLDGAEKAPGRLLLYLEAAAEAHVPDAHGAATDALAAGLPVSEAAGILAESLFGSELVIVCDNVDRILDSGPAMSALSALARYVPVGVNLVLISREPLLLDLVSSSEAVRVGEIDDRDLAFTVPEAKVALSRAGRPGVDPTEAVAVSNGWATGVMYADEFSADWNAETLHRYLASEVLNTLTPDEKLFLTYTSLLAEVTVVDAAALGVPDPERTISVLRGRRLPLTWIDERSFTVGLQFRELLIQELAALGREATAPVRRRFAELLERRGEVEEAVDAWIELGDIESAWRLARPLLPLLVDRMDLALAARWLDACGDRAEYDTIPLANSAMRTAFGLDRPLRGARLLQRCGWSWVEALSQSEDFAAEEALALLVWCLWHASEMADAEKVVAQMRHGYARSVAESVLGLSRSEAPGDLPAVSMTPVGPLEALLLRVAHIRGRLIGPEGNMAPGQWRSAVGAPWIVAGLRATGRIDEAVKLYESHRSKPQPLWLHAVDAPELMADLRRTDDAREALAYSWHLQRETGSAIYRILLHITEARLAVRLDDDLNRAAEALDAADAAGAQAHSFTREFAGIERGRIALLRDNNSEAVAHLEQAIASISRTDHRLELVTAKILAAEALWRIGDEDGADVAAAGALSAAEEASTLHLLLVALERFPEVAIRAADAEVNRTGRWHEMTALLSRRSELRVSPRQPKVLLEEFGEPAIILEGMDVTPRLRKSVELLARIVAAPGRSVTRHALLTELFESRSDAAARSYLRQALYRLREVLPADALPALDGDSLVAPGYSVLASSAEEVLAGIRSADRQDDERRLRTLTASLARAERGPYLLHCVSPWSDTRREEIQQILLGARMDIARVSLRLGRYWECATAIDHVLRVDPYREDAWLLRLSLSHANGIDEGVLMTYQRYLAAMRDLGVPPSAEVQRQAALLRS